MMSRKRWMLTRTISAIHLNLSKEVTHNVIDEEKG
jgi:hypothetical protein